ncbi:kinesin-related protein 4 isoform X10 [Nerophis ophidion]|uniref:kinesin-related protein 4 isoform X10 n=1 Tax=Nerophis ophidion TaxID=159077 RepID=UPI002ADF46B8|nr:kinesin-related protein 4 isoform X10 [Nerophis ophidion]
MSNNKPDMSNMGSQVTGRKRSSNKDRSTAEDEALNLIAKEAEARLAAKRAARAEAREIRMRELERQQKELSDDDEHMSVGVRSDLDSIHCAGGSSLVSHKKSKKKKKHKHKDKERNGCDDDEYSVVSSRSSKLSDDSKVSRSSRGDLLSLQYSSYPRSRSSSRNSSARASPVDQCASVATFLRRAASSNALTCNLDQVSIPDFSHSSSAASTLTATTITSLGASSSRTGSGETVDAESAVREIKEIHELKDQIQDVESKYTHNLKEAKDALTEVEEKYRKAMVSNAQLDNDKNNLMYQVDTLKDSLMELEELLSESRREYQDKVKELEREKHAHSVLHFQLITMKESLQQSEELLNEIRQLRMKQDTFSREICDLQETLEWKDKKIGALERQKEYTEAIRTERDVLREEVVMLKDILKKHGVVLSINGGAAEMDTAISSREDCSSSQTEVNCMLGSSVDAQLRSSGKEAVDQEQHQDVFEEIQTSRLSADTLSNTDKASIVESCSTLQSSKEHEIPLKVVNGGQRLEWQAEVDKLPITKVFNELLLSSELEENASHSEDVPHVKSDLEEIVTTTNDVFKDKFINVFEENPHKPKTIQKCHLINTQSCLQNVIHSESRTQEDSKDSESCLEKVKDAVSCSQRKCTKDSELRPQVGNVKVLESEAILGVSNTEHHCGSENAETKNNEGEEIQIEAPPKSVNALGKKKKKKRRGTKKGVSCKEIIQSKHNDRICPKKIQLAALSECSTDGHICECIQESSADQVIKETDQHQATEQMEHTEVSNVEQPNKSKMDSFSGQWNNEKHLKAVQEPGEDRILKETDRQDAKRVDSAQAEHHETSIVQNPKESNMDLMFNTDEHNHEQNVEAEVDIKDEKISLPLPLSQTQSDQHTDQQNLEQTLESVKSEGGSTRSSDPRLSFCIDFISTNTNKSLEKEDMPTADTQDDVTTLDTQDDMTTVDTQDGLTTVDTQNDVTTIETQKVVTIVDTQDDITVDAHGVTTTDTQDMTITNTQDVTDTHDVTNVDTQEDVTTVDTEDVMTIEDTMDDVTTIETQKVVTIVDTQDDITVDAHGVTTTDTQDMTITNTQDVTATDTHDVTNVDTQDDVITVDIQDDVTTVDTEDDMTIEDTMDDVTTVDTEDHVTTIDRQDNGAAKCNNEITEVESNVKNESHIHLSVTEESTVQLPESPSELSAAKNSNNDDVLTGGSDKGRLVRTCTNQKDEEPQVGSREIYFPSVTNPNHILDETSNLSEIEEEHELLDLVKPKNSSHEHDIDKTQTERLTLGYEDQIDDAASDTQGQTQSSPYNISPMIVQQLTTEQLASEDNPTEHKNGKSDQKSLIAQPLLESSSVKKSEPSNTSNSEQCSEEDTEENEEGQSFDFDDLNTDVAVEIHTTIDQDDKSEMCVPQGKQMEDEVCTDAASVNKDAVKKHSVLVPLEASSKNLGIVEEHEEKLGKISAMDEQTFVPKDRQSSKAGGFGVLQNTSKDQAVPLPVEEALDVVEQLHEVGANRVTVKDVKNNCKKGKTKGKEDCKMT